MVSYMPKYHKGNFYFLKNPHKKKNIFHMIFNDWPPLFPFLMLVTLLEK